MVVDLAVRFTLGVAWLRYLRREVLNILKCSSGEKSMRQDDIGSKIPGHCKYWRFQGDHNLIGCSIDATLCRYSDCDPNKIDPTGLLRRRINGKGRNRAGDKP